MRDGDREQRRDKYDDEDVAKGARGARYLNQDHGDWTEV